MKTRGQTRRHRMECLVRNSVRSTIRALYYPFEELAKTNYPEVPLDMARELIILEDRADLATAHRHMQQCIHLAVHKLRKDSHLRRHEVREPFSLIVYPGGIIYVFPV